MKVKTGSAHRSLPAPLLRSLIREVVAETLLCDYLRVGDEVLFGKWKNKRGVILSVFEDERGVPCIEVERLPSRPGRQRIVVIPLYNVRRAASQVT